MAIFRRDDDSNGITLARLLQTGKAMPPTEAYEKVRALTATLLPVADYDLRPLLRPDNIVDTGGALALRSTKVSRIIAKNPPVFPGFTPPECYPGAASPPGGGGGAGGNDAPRASPASAVYTVGAVLAALLRGHAPPPANTRPPNDFPLFQRPTVLEEIINFSTLPDPASRPASLRDFYDLLVLSRQRIYLDYKR